MILYGKNMDKPKIFKEAFSEDFITLKKNRIIVGHFKYGGSTKENSKKIDFIKQLEFKLKAYKKTGNPEYLVDVSNYAMFEFKLMRGDFRGTDDDEYSKLIN